MSLLQNQLGGLGALAGCGQLAGFGSGIGAGLQNQLQASAFSIARDRHKIIILNEPTLREELQTETDEWLKEAIK